MVKKIILFVTLISVLFQLNSTFASESQGGVNFGIGLDIGMQFNKPEKVNRLISNVWDEMKSDFIGIEEKGTAKMILSYPIRLKGILAVSPFLSFESFAQYSYAKKYLKIENKENSNYVNEVDIQKNSVIGGLNIWFRVKQAGPLSFKTGLGFYGMYTKIDISGSRIGKGDIKGPGYIGNVLAGMAVRFPRISLNLNMAVPVGIIKYTHRHNTLKDDYFLIKFPEQDYVKGFELYPGITFHF